MTILPRNSNRRAPAALGRGSAGRAIARSRAGCGMVLLGCLADGEMRKSRLA